jgi:hypothetical protein
MTSLASTLRASVFAAACLLAGSAVLAAQDVPADLTVLPSVPDQYKPKMTPWGDPDFRGTWPIDSIASLPFQRPDRYGNRFWLTDEEFTERQKQASASDERYAQEDKEGRIGMGHWVESDASGRRTSLLIDPPNGKLPEFTEKGRKLYEAGRSSWVRDQNFDWVTDFDSWDRCVSRGFPASMLPFRYNNGIRVMQSPGYVVIDLEMIHDSRIIPVVPKEKWKELQKRRWPANVTSWMGQSLGYWEDANTLVIETRNIRAGDSATHDSARRAASPLNMATMGVPPNNTIPTSDKAEVVERLTMTGQDSIVYELTYSDPETFTAPWTARLDWQRNDAYQFFEYACHEGNVQIRNYITASRAKRAQEAQPAPAKSGSR